MPIVLTNYAVAVSTVPVNNPYSTTGTSQAVTRGLLNPESLADFLNFTSLDGLSVLSISNRDYYNYCTPESDEGADDGVCDCPEPSEACRPAFSLEKHITVIRKGPTMAPALELFPYEDVAVANADGSYDRADVNLSPTDDAIINTSFTGDRIHQSSNFAVINNPGLGGDGLPVALSTHPANFNYADYWGDPNGDFNTQGTGFDLQDISLFYKPNKEAVSVGETVIVPINIQTTGEDWEVNDQIIIEYEYLDSFGDSRKATARLQITGLADLDVGPDVSELTGYGWHTCDPAGSICQSQHITARLMSRTGNFPQNAITPEDLYNVFLVQKPPIFEVKFPKFAYRYKYEDGEYSVFGPWSEIAFIPGQFDYLPKKGYNLGMQNKLRSVNIKNWVPKNIPEDVVQVDILYKESNSPNIYTVSSHKKDDLPEGGNIENYWNTSGNGGHNGFYTIKSELIHKVVKSNQLLRPWDNVPRKALAQEITANRLIFANYVQNFDLKDKEGNEVKVAFSPTITSSDYSMDSSGTKLPGYPGKSLKSMRTYQIGVVYRGRYGRETPVMTSKSGSLKLSKQAAKLQNRLSVQLHNKPPYWAESFTFYIKETSNEYYNLSMDRWYDAEDGGVWISFPSSERNKITDRTNLILKKQHDTDVFTDFETKYKVLSIKNDAPTFVKTENKYWGSLPMMLPPPGWSSLGTWDSGMFYNTGLPLPNRMYLDIYAEYWDQSSFNELRTMSGAQIRIVQSAGTASAYNATTSDTTNKTRWYDVASISYIGSPAQTQEISTPGPNPGDPVITQVVELPGQQEQLVRVSLEKTFGNDALFCEPADNLSLSRGLSIEARTKVVRDKSQFEGRFFVKILRDANIEINIVNPQLETEDKYQILFSRKLKYIAAAHPGLQDWSFLHINTDGTKPVGTGVRLPNFIPIAINMQEGDGANYGLSSSPIKGTQSGINEYLYNIPPGGLGGFGVTRLVSSLSSTHANKGATFVSELGGIFGKPDGTNEARLWPYGPGRAAMGAFDTNGVGSISSISTHLIGGDYSNPPVNKKLFPSYRVGVTQLSGGQIPQDLTTFVHVISGATMTPIKYGTPNATFTATGGAFPSSDGYFAGPADMKGEIYDWPSYGIGVWNPYLRYFSDDDGNPAPACGGCDQHSGAAFAWAEEQRGPYIDRIGAWIKKQSVLNIKSCIALGPRHFGSAMHQGVLPTFPANTTVPAPGTNNAAGDPITSTLAPDHAYNIDPNYEDHNYLQGANPYMLPAIWGNQIDFLRAGDPANIGWLGFIPATAPEWRPTTMADLKEDWYYLFLGRDECHETWPLGRFSPDRWFIDKAGAAQGHSGNGIWADESTGIGYMDVSFYGVGTRNSQHIDSRKMSMKDTMIKHNENEIGFADALRTPGTQFRFTHDPDKIVYTITGVKENEVYNYEAPRGIWGVGDSPALYGSGIGKKSPAPYSSVEGLQAFISDLYSKEIIDSGSYPTNLRLRWTLTLDKIIGQEGEHKFHPITNHVDENQKANIEIGRAIYSTHLPSNHITPEKGGTPLGANGEVVEYYNLASYHNTTANAANQNPTLDDIIASGDSGSTPSAEFSQPDTIDYTDDSNFYTRNPNAYIGLHERGLNQTAIEIVTPYKGEDRDRPMSTNPAIWETEPLEDVGLDIYYAAGPTYPINIERHRNDGVAVLDGPDEEDAYGANWYDYSGRGEEVIRVGSIVEVISSVAGTITDAPTVCKVQGNMIWLTKTDVATEHAFNQAGIGVQLSPGDTIKITWRGEGTFYGVGNDKEWVDFVIEEYVSPTSYRVSTNLHNNAMQLGYYNCWSYNTGVESNRVRDDYNAVTIDKGVKASMPLASTYEEERRSSGLIFSGIYNSTSGVNETNQFIQAEPITKDLNPINGSIQKLFARDTDLLTFCENKVFKILAKKDALFNADGNTNITSNAAVLGQSMPFTGEYGISRNPESFASESYRVYFADKDRGSILRLSKDGLTPISDQGMKDWFKDNLRFSSTLVGSYDSRDDQFNLTLETADQDGQEKAYTVSYVEKKRGWVSFKSFINQGGISHKNTYYTTPSNKFGRFTSQDPWEVSYAVPSSGLAEMWQHSLDLKITRTTVAANSTNKIVVVSGAGTIVKGMYVEGNGIPIDTIVTAVVASGGNFQVTLNHHDSVINHPNAFVSHDLATSSLKVNAGSLITFTTGRNNFYNNFDHYSMIKVIFNGDKGTVKRFKTLDYEGSQAETIEDLTNMHSIEGQNIGEIYYDNHEKKGWYVRHIETDLQVGKVNEFISKENKWFNSIMGLENAGIEDNLDTGEFSLQGLGYYLTLI